MELPLVYRMRTDNHDYCADSSADDRSEVSQLCWEIKKEPLTDCRRLTNKAKNWLSLWG